MKDMDKNLRGHDLMIQKQHAHLNQNVHLHK